MTVGQCVSGVYQSFSCVAEWLRMCFRQAGRTQADGVEALLLQAKPHTIRDGRKFFTRPGMPERDSVSEIRRPRLHIYHVAVQHARYAPPVVKHNDQLRHFLYRAAASRTSAYRVEYT